MSVAYSGIVVTWSVTCAVKFVVTEEKAIIMHVQTDKKLCVCVCVDCTLLVQRVPQSGAALSMVPYRVATGLLLR